MTLYILSLDIIVVTAVQSIMRYSRICRKQRWEFNASGVDKKIEKNILGHI